MGVLLAGELSPNAFQAVNTSTTSLVPFSESPLPFTIKQNQVIDQTVHHPETCLLITYRPVLSVMVCALKTLQTGLSPNAGIHHRAVFVQ